MTRCAGIVMRMCRPLKTVNDAAKNYAIGFNRGLPTQVVTLSIAPAATHGLSHRVFFARLIRQEK